MRHSLLSTPLTHSTTVLFTVSFTVASGVVRVFSPPITASAMAFAVLFIAEPKTDRVSSMPFGRNEVAFVAFTTVAERDDEGCE
jgi:hypothetical protein